MLNFMLFNLQFLYMSAMEDPVLSARLRILSRLCPAGEVKSTAAWMNTPSSSVSLSSCFT